MALRLVPVDWRTACGFVLDWHRHHEPPTGYKWAHGDGPTDDRAADKDVGVGGNGHADRHRRSQERQLDAVRRLRPSGLLPPRSGWSAPSRPRNDRGVDGIPRTLWEAV